MGHPFSRRLLLFVSMLITLLLTLNIFFTYRNSQEIEKNRLRQVQSEEIKAALSRIAIDVIHNLDLGIRSYALFTEERYLYPYHIALQEKDVLLGRLERKLYQQEYPLTELYRLRDSINAYTSLNIALKTLIDTGRLSEFRYLANQDKGYRLWLQYERFAAKVNDFEDQIHTRASSRYRQALRSNYLIQLSLFLICMPTLLFTIIYTNRAFTLEVKVKAAEMERAQLLLRQNEELERNVLERTKEIHAQNEELISINNKLFQKQEEISQQRDQLAQQNQELFEVRQYIEEQNQTLDQEVKARTQELAEYNQQLEQFAFMAAHNLRAPVARILGLGQVLGLSSLKPDEEKMMIDKLVYTTEELDRVVKDMNQILEIKKNTKLELTEINLREEVSQIKANMENEILDTETNIQEDFSQIDTIRTVKPYLHSILYNLISNAIKYRNPKQKLHIGIRTESHGEYMSLSVSDNGLGIDLTAHEKKLFNLYKRFHTHVEGKGMGLYLVKSQVTALEGRIEVTSQVNQGTTFKIYLKHNNQTNPLASV